MFEPRDFPKVIIVEDSIIEGPFCKPCGNPAFLHRPIDAACPRRRLSVLFPIGEREKNCQCNRLRAEHRQYGPPPTYMEDCPVYVHHPNQQADIAFAERMRKKKR